jgi:hypothetical protein
MMPAKSKSFAVALSCVVVIGCGSAKLNCSDQAVTDLVIQIARREMANDRNKVPAPSQFLDNRNTVITLEGIRTRMANELVLLNAQQPSKFLVAWKPGGKFLEDVLKGRIESMTNKAVTAPSAFTPRLQCSSQRF